MALFSRNHLPHRASLSRFLAAIDGACLNALHHCFNDDLGHHGFTDDILGGLCDHPGA